MIDVGRQRSSLGHGGQIDDPERCIRDRCANRIVPTVSLNFCPDCYEFMRETPDGS